MASGFEDNEKINKLPQEGVHCFPASAKQINGRRVITAILFVVFACIAIYGFAKMGSLLPAAIIGAIGAVVVLLVFIQTFLIAKFRVAVDYNEKNVVLRFRYSTIKIPFESFDARDGEPDKAEQLIDKNMSAEKAMYLVLDNVFEDACFQTSTRDLASKEDFMKLREETFAIAEAYGARNSENKVRFWNESEKDTDIDDDDIASIVEEAKAATGGGCNDIIEEPEEEAETPDEAPEADTEAESDTEEKTDEE
ncbi:hypothetical protein SAMN02910456_00059 [Ruminococcaceae bacterium YRB3002]|nr:hypothetical protein SAMN02910456_00059 [Ruminococcaceae bacterium YRB3002]